MAESIPPVEIVPLEQAAPAVSGVEAYFCGEEGWRSTCFRELGGVAFLGTVGGLLLNGTYNALASAPEAGTNSLGSAVATGFGVLGYGAIGIMRAYRVRRQEVNPVPWDEGETDYHILSGRRPPRDT